MSFGSFALRTRGCVVDYRCRKPCAGALGHVRAVQLVQLVRPRHSVKAQRRQLAYTDLLSMVQNELQYQIRIYTPSQLQQVEAFACSCFTKLLTIQSTTTGSLLLCSTPMTTISPRHDSFRAYL